MDPTDLDEGPGSGRKSYRFEVPTRLNFVPPPEPDAPDYASIEARAKALAIDALLWFAAAVPLGVIFDGISSSNGFLRIKIGGPPVLMATVLWLVYMTLMESRYGASVGKRARGLRVVMEDGAPVTPEAALFRNLLRFLDAAPYAVPYLVAYIAASKSPLMQRFGDRVAETTVVVSTPASAADEHLRTVLTPLGLDAPAPSVRRKSRLRTVLIATLLVLVAGGAAALLLIRGAG